MKLRAKEFRIGLDARPLTTRVSGVGRFIAETLKAFPDKFNYRFILYTNKPIHPNHNILLELPNIEVRQTHGFLSKKGGTFFNIQLPFLLQNEELDLFWGSQQVLPPFLPAGLPAVLTYYDLVLYLYPDTMRPIALLQQKFFQKYSVNRSQYILSISDQTRRDMMKKFHYPESKTDVSYPGVDLFEIKELLEREASPEIASIDFQFLLTVSTIEPRKNYPFLLEVYKAYRKKAKDTHLKWVIVGKLGWESTEFYKELHHEIKTHQDIIHIESADDIDLHHLYRKCTIFLFSSFYEGFGIPVLEALAHRKPCIVSDIPVFHEIGKDSIAYLPIKDPIVWANEIYRMQNLQRVAYINLEEFSWKHSAQTTKNVFDTFLKKEGWNPEL